MLLCTLSLLYITAKCYGTRASSTDSLMRWWCFWYNSYIVEWVPPGGLKMLDLLQLSSWELIGLRYHKQILFVCVFDVKISTSMCVNFFVLWAGVPTMGFHWVVLWRDSFILPTDQTWEKTKMCMNQSWWWENVLKCPCWNFVEEFDFFISCIMWI